MFQSIRSKLQLMVLLLGIIIFLTFLNLYMNQHVVKLEHDYAEVSAINNNFNITLGTERSSLGDPVAFSRLETSYVQLYQSCLRCHDTNPGGLLLIRKSILRELHQNKMVEQQLRQTLSIDLDGLSLGIRAIHEGHIMVLRTLLYPPRPSAPPRPNAPQGDSTLPLELATIQQTITMQHGLADIKNYFYLLKEGRPSAQLQKDLLGSIATLYTTAESFTTSKLNIREQQMMLRILTAGKSFKSSFSQLIQLGEKKRSLSVQLNDNQKQLKRTITKVIIKIRKKREAIHRQLLLVESSSFLFIAFLILMIVRQCQAIVRSIRRLIRETNRIKNDYLYQIPDDPNADEEFKILSKALNGMAKNLDSRISTLRRETRLRIMAEKVNAETEIRLQRAKQTEAIGTLAGGLAHDFNNLLTAILGNINLATYTLPPNHEVYDNLIQAEKASKRAHKLTKQLLTFSKGGAPTKETAPIYEVIQESAFFVLHGSNVNCNIDIPEDLWLVKIDKGQIGQVIQNLVLNADQSMPQGGTIQIICTNFTATPDTNALKEGPYVKVEVHDQGLGIKGQNIQRIFDPYFTTKGKGSIQGSGLGLAIVHSIITRHGGTINVESTEKIGTTFTFFIPAEDVAMSPINLLNGDIISGKGKILVMDDESLILKVMQHSLPTLGYEVATADSGQLALKMYENAAQEEEPFSLVIMDLTIPGGMGGQEAALKILEKYPDAFILVSSGYADDPIMQNPQDYGFKAALPKPYELRELSQILHEYLPSPKDSLPE